MKITYAAALWKYGEDQKKVDRSTASLFVQEELAVFVEEMEEQLYVF